MQQDWGKVQEYEEWHDVYFKIGDPQMEGDLSKYERIGSVRIMLAVRSSVFKSMLYGHMLEAQVGIDVEIPDAEPQIFRILLKYIFSDSTENLNGRNVMKVGQIANKYDVPGLTKACETYIRRHQRSVFILLERNMKNYYGFLFPDISSMAEKVFYFGDFTVSEFREAVASQLRLPVEKLQFWSMDNGYIIVNDPPTNLNHLEESSARLNRNFGPFYVRILGDSALLPYSVNDRLVCFKYVGSESGTMRYVGSRVYSSPEEVPRSTLFDDFANFVEGKTNVTYMIEDLSVPDNIDGENFVGCVNYQAGGSYLDDSTCVLIFTDFDENELSQFYKKEIDIIGHVQL